MLDVEAFASRLSAAYQRLWLIAAAITGDRTEADDIVQEAALVALRKLGEFQEGSNFSAWMAQIVRLTALNHVRKLGRQSTLPTDPLTLDQSAAHSAISQNASPLAVGRDGQLTPYQKDFDDEVLAALADVAEIARACLLLRTVQQLSYDEIAATLQIPAGTAMSHVHRAREQLRARLNQPYSSTKGSDPTRL